MKFNEIGGIVDASELAIPGHRTVKATVQRSGRIGYSSEAARLLCLKPKEGALVAKNETGIFVKHVQDDPRAFPIKVSSGYYSFDARGWLTSLGIDYANKTETTIFDIVSVGVDEEDGLPIWEFKKRVVQVRPKCKVSVDKGNEEGVIEHGQQE